MVFLNPSTATEGDTIVVSGAGFEPDIKVNIFYDVVNPEDWVFPEGSYQVVWTSSSGNLPSTIIPVAQLPAGESTGLSAQIDIIVSHEGGLFHGQPIARATLTIVAREPEEHELDIKIDYDMENNCFLLNLMVSYEGNPLPATEVNTTISGTITRSYNTHSKEEGSENEIFHIVDTCGIQNAAFMVTGTTDDDGRVSINLRDLPRDVRVYGSAGGSEFMDITEYIEPLGGHPPWLDGLYIRLLDFSEAMHKELKIGENGLTVKFEAKAKTEIIVEGDEVICKGESSSQLYTIDYIAKIINLIPKPGVGSKQPPYTKLRRYIHSKDAPEDLDPEEVNPDDYWSPPVYVSESDLPLKLKPHDMVVCTSYEEVDFGFIEIGQKGRLTPKIEVVGEGEAFFIIQPTRLMCGFYDKAEKLRKIAFGESFFWGIVGGAVGTVVGFIGSKIPGAIAGFILGFLIGHGLGTVYPAYKEIFNTPFSKIKIESTLFTYYDGEGLELYLLEGSGKIYDDENNLISTVSDNEMISIEETGTVQGPNELNLGSLDIQLLESMLQMVQGAPDSYGIEERLNEALSTDRNFSSLNLDVRTDSSKYRQGDSMRIYGRVTSQEDVIEGAAINIEIQSPKGYHYKRNSTTDENGVFYYETGFTDNASTGSWMFKITAEKQDYIDETFSFSIYLSQKRQESEITLTLEESETLKGEPIRIEGKLTPEDSGQFIRLLFTKPDYSLEEMLCITDFDGSFSYNYYPTELGSWSVTADWEGYDDFHNSTSNKVSFTVNEHTNMIPGYPPASIILGFILLILMWTKSKNQYMEPK